uniref:Ig-like domain-containing protein n=1 Tax=Salarias fasciatus TaxID=181472 RepID=A0A672FFR3_SALFA
LKEPLKLNLQLCFCPPSVLMVKLGESAKLSCQATGEPAPRIIWISPRKDVISVSSSRFQISSDGTLVLNKVTLADEGKYTCVARNSAGDDVKDMKIEVESQEPFINGLKGKSATKVLGISYQTALLHCRVEGKPEPRVWWVTPFGLSLTTPYLGGRFQVHQNGSLELRGVRKTDEGRYMCVAKNHLGESSLLVDVEVASVAEKPSFAVPNIEILPLKQGGRELLLECPARGKPSPEYLWVLPNGTILTPGIRLQRCFSEHSPSAVRNFSFVFDASEISSLATFFFKTRLISLTISFQDYSSTSQYTLSLTQLVSEGIHVTE